MMTRRHSRGYQRCRSASLLLLISLFSCLDIRSIAFQQPPSGVNQRPTPRTTSSLRHVNSFFSSKRNVHSPNEPSIPSSMDSATATMIPDPNDHRYAASDWFHILCTLPKSTVLKTIRGPLLAVFGWSALVSVVQKIAVYKDWSALATHMCFSSQPHSFLVSALGLLLVFRTNSAYQRFNEGRKIWECIHSESRNLSRLAILYEKELGRTRTLRFFSLLAAYPYLLHQHIQPRNDPHAVGEPFGIILPEEDFRGYQRKRAGMFDGFLKEKRNRRKATQNVNGSNMQHWVDRRQLPWCLLPPKALEQCVQSPNRPLWVCDRLAQEAMQVTYTDNFTSRERLQFLSQIGRLTQAIGQCERIHQTAVPLNYARHSLRSLTLWLFTLPFALVKDFGLLTAPIIGFVSWVLFGVYQIGYSIEDPFQGSLRLSLLCDAIYRDLMNDADRTKCRLSAFQTAASDDPTEWKGLVQTEIDSTDLPKLTAPQNETQKLTGRSEKLEQREAETLDPKDSLSDPPRP